MLTRLGYLVEEQGMTYMADMDTGNPLASLQAASCTYRIALGPRAGQKVLSLRTVAGRDEKTTAALCANAHGFSLHAGVRCGAHQRKELERLCRYITRLAIANERPLCGLLERQLRVHTGHESFPKAVIESSLVSGRSHLRKVAIKCVPVAPSRTHSDRRSSACNLQNDRAGNALCYAM